MKLPLELEDQYVKEVLYNRSLKDLPNEEWKLIEGFEYYAISNYGRVKSLQRIAPSVNGNKKILPEKILKLVFPKYFNKYLNRYFHYAVCRFSWEGKRYPRSVAGLVYYHFVEKFDMHDLCISIAPKDNNRLHLHSSNLEKISASERRQKSYRLNRTKNVHIIYLQPISQYTVEGNFVADFESFYAAEKKLGIGLESILNVINKEFLTAGTFRWFLKGDSPKEEDFIISEKLDTSDRLLNKVLWKKLGMPSVDEKNPPACMNLSIKSLPGEQWKPLPGFEGKYAISDKGRIKRLNGWNSAGRRFFLKEMIISQCIEFSTNTNYFLYCTLYNNEEKIYIPVSRLLYYCFVKEFDINDKTLVVINKNEPKWKMNLSKLSLQLVFDKLQKEEKGTDVCNLNKIRVVLNSGEIFNEVLWKRLNKPKIDKDNPPDSMNLSLKNLPDEHWNPLPGFEGKYMISNKGRIKRLSGWAAGNQFFEEEEIIALKLMKLRSAYYLSFRLPHKVCRNQMILSRFLYYCFVEKFNLENRTLLVINKNKPLWNIDLSKLSLSTIGLVLHQKKRMDTL
jgi:hypothetical protein